MSVHAPRFRPVGIAVVVGVALVVALWPARDAHACSCGEPDLAPVIAGDADQALVLAERVDLDGGRDGALRVLEVLAGADEVGPVDARFDDGGSCDPWLSGGAVGALLLARDGDRWTTTTCGMVPVGTALAAADAGLAIADETGEATMLLAGAFGGARVAAVDADGRVTARATGDGRTVALAPCPGGEALVEVALDDGEQAVLHRWSVPSLDPLGDPVPLDGRPAFTAAARCLDETGERVVVALPRYGEPGAVVVVEGQTADLTAAPVVDAHAAGGTLAVLVGDGTPQGRTDVIGVVDDDGIVRPLLQREDTVFDRLATSPSGALVAAGGYPDDGEDRIVVASVDGTTQTDRTLAGFHVLGWLDADRVWLRDDHALAYGAAATTRGTRDTSLEDLGPVDTGPGQHLAALPDGGVLRWGGVVPSVLRGDEVARVADVRLAATDHVLVLDEDAVLTAAVPESAPAPSTEATDLPRGRAVGTPWLVLLAGAVVVGGAWAVRRGRSARVS